MLIRWGHFAGLYENWNIEEVRMLQHFYKKTNRHINLHKRVSCGYSGWYSGSSVNGGIVLLLAIVGFTITTAGSLLPTELKAKTCLWTKWHVKLCFQHKEELMMYTRQVWTDHFVWMLSLPDAPDLKRRISNWSVTVAYYGNKVKSFSSCINSYDFINYQFVQSSQKVVSLNLILSEVVKKSRELFFQTEKGSQGLED